MTVNPFTRDFKCWQPRWLDPIACEILYDGFFACIHFGVLTWARWLHPTVGKFLHDGSPISYRCSVLTQPLCPDATGSEFHYNGFPCLLLVSSANMSRWPNVSARECSSPACDWFWVLTCARLHDPTESWFLHDSSMTRVLTRAQLHDPKESKSCITSPPLATSSEYWHELIACFHSMSVSAWRLPPCYRLWVLTQVMVGSDREWVSAGRFLLLPVLSANASPITWSNSQWDSPWWFLRFLWALNANGSPMAWSDSE